MEARYDAGEWRMIKHDDKYLYGGGVEYDNHPEGLELEVIGVAKRYYEHMTRWRGMDEMPEIGQLIEAAYGLEDEMGSLQDDDKFSMRITYNGIIEPELGYEIRFTPYAWRPVGELPEVSDVA